MEEAETTAGWARTPVSRCPVQVYMNLSALVGGDATVTGLNFSSGIAGARTTKQRGENLQEQPWARPRDTRSSACRGHPLYPLPLSSAHQWKSLATKGPSDSSASRSCMNSKVAGCGHGPTVGPWRHVSAVLGGPERGAAAKTLIGDWGSPLKQTNNTNNTTNRSKSTIPVDPSNTNRKQKGKTRNGTRRHLPPARALDLPLPANDTLAAVVPLLVPRIGPQQRAGRWRLLPAQHV